MGMGRAELEHALVIGKPPENPYGRSQFGLGMKTAACWFGDEWTVTTKKLGLGQQVSITVDVERVAAGDINLPDTTGAKPANLHYTIIEIRKLHSKMNRPDNRKDQGVFEVDVPRRSAPESAKALLGRRTNSLGCRASIPRTERVLRIARRSTSRLMANAYTVT